MRITKYKKSMLLTILVILMCFSACAKSDVTIPFEDVPKESNVIITLDNVPEFNKLPYVEINGNNPYFTEAELTTECFELYSELDNLGRCGVCYANVGIEIMPTEERGEIGKVKPSGWQLMKYDIVEGKYLYNRCHLIGFQLAGENANEKNLITGTRYMNVQGMLPFESEVAEYVKITNNHVLYRVTPIFKDNNLVASGVLMEAKSVEDDGLGICFCVYVYNCQPGISIDYATGESFLKDYVVNDPQEDLNSSQSQDMNIETIYVLNINTKKFHNPTCGSVDDMKEKNKKIFQGNRDDIINQGYTPCKRCKP